MNICGKKIEDNRQNKPGLNEAIETNIAKGIGQLLCIRFGPKLNMFVVYMYITWKTGYTGRPYSFGIPYPRISAFGHLHHI
jgi:hypothetical protein